MLRTLLTTTALAALLTTGAMAQDAAAPANPAPATDAAAPAAGSSILAKGYTAVDSDNLATHIIGTQVYSSAAADAEHIGDVNDLVLNQDGSIAAVVIGVGGFLGVGEKNVAVNYDELQWTVAEDNSERFVLATTKEALNSAPAFEWHDDQPADTAANNNAGTDANNMAANNAATDNAMAPADNNNMAANNNATADATTTGSVDANNNAVAPADQAANPGNAVDTSQFTDVTLTADELKGTTAYGPNNEELGKVGDILLADDGKTVDAVIIDFGGFLGIGTKPVAVGFDTLKFQQDQNGNHFVFLNVTRDQLDQAVAFDADAYKADPSKQRMVIQG